MTRDASRRVARDAWRHGQVTHGERAIPEEIAVAFTYNGGTHAVMMATPRDLADFATGFSLTEGVLGAADEIERLEIVEAPLGIELRMWLPDATARTLQDRRRYQAGPTGCGLCGIESLEGALRVLPMLAGGLTVTPADIAGAVAALGPRQTLNHETRAVHAAAFWQPGIGIVAVREDVGRHNALDKLVGALARIGIAGASGVLLLTSRVSVELVQKAAMAGMPILVAVSAPTVLAVATADAAGLTLAAIARDDGFEIFTHPRRITDAAPLQNEHSHVA